MIPLPYRIIALLALLAACWWAGMRHGAGEVKEAWALHMAKDAEEHASLRAKAAEVTTREVVRYVDRVRVVRQRGASIVREVPRYVPVQADAACSVPAGFVRVHDAAAADVVPDAPGAADGAASGVALSAVAEVVSDNYYTCHGIREQLTALQGWVKAQKEASDGR